jgi:hypothetical protein
MRGLVQLASIVTLSLAAVPAAAQVRCKMPNGMVITQQLGNCPKDAQQLTPAPSTPTASTNSAAPAAKPATATPLPAPKSPSTTDSNDGFPMLTWLVVVGLGVALIFAIKGSGGTSGPAQFCTTCGHEGQAKTKTRGSTAIELILWLCFLVPGLIYSFWRLGSKYKACTQCGGTTLVPPASPIAVATKKRLSA